MSRRTNATIEFGLVDVSAKEDSALTVTDKQPFSNVEKIEHDGLDFKNYASFEWNRWTLDGTFSIKPDTGGDIGWWSSEMSNAGGVMAVPPVLTINFSKPHSSIGITLTFLYEDHPSEVNVKWYYDSSLRAEKTDYPNKTIYPISEGVENYNKIVITFLKTARPYRYLKITRIDYGITQIFGDNELMAAKLNEEIDPLSETITINTLSFKLHSTDAAFSIINPDGIYQYLQQRQELSSYETVNGEKRFLGTHYLSEWSGENENTFTMKAIDKIGLMDGSRFAGGIYVNQDVTELLEKIVSDAGFVVSGTGEILLVVSDAFANVKVSGHIPLCSHRDAIQQVAFAIGGVVDTSRTDKIVIYNVDHNPGGVILRSRKFTGQKVELEQFITGVEVVEHTYGLSSKVENLFEDVLPVGESFVKFGDPSSITSVVGGSIVEEHVNYAIINVTSEQKVTVSGKKYIDNQKIVGAYLPGLPAAQSKKILSVSDATLVSKTNSKQVADWVLDLHQKRIRQDFTFICDTENVGMSYSVETLYGQGKAGVLTSLETDLVKGFIGKAVVIGE